MLGLAQACSTVRDHGCERFATMETMCESKVEDAPRDRLLATMMCSESQTQGDDWLGELQARQVQCARQSSNCEVYQDCKFHIELP